jgi:hypothetical protein
MSDLCYIICLMRDARTPVSFHPPLTAMSTSDEILFHSTLGEIMRVLASLSLFTSLSVFAACPDLTGTFKTCTSDADSTNPSTDMVVVQAVKSGVTTYTVSSTSAEGERITETYIADGKTRSETQTDPETGMVFTFSQNVVCVGSTLKVRVGVRIPEQSIADLTMLASKTGQRMTMVTSGTMLEQNVKETEICE